jgi:hypothetical protein
MSFNESELNNHCLEILKDPAIRNRIVVLCEGKTEPFKQTTHAPRIKEFSEITQDSAFYYRAIPTWWKETRKREPEFRVCGTQTNVIIAYFKLLENHHQNPKNSYLNPEKLFALVDIDFQKKKLPQNYTFSNLEAIYEDLYSDGKVNSATFVNHKIWVTGLAHKEAYFFVPEPELKLLFDNYPLPPLFNNQPLKLEDIYHAILETMLNHGDIKDNFTRTIKRIAHKEQFKKCKSIEEFQTAWKIAFANNETMILAIYALLTIAKSKPSWEQIKPNATANNIEIKTYLDDLSLIIAREFYAKQPRDSQHHLTYFFNALSANT